jgi:hypothetical protein
MPDAAHQYEWTVKGGPAVRPATVSNAPIATVLQIAAGLLGVGIVLAVVAMVLAARRGRRSEAVAGAAAVESPDDVLVGA